MKNLQIMNMSRKYYLILTIIMVLLLFPIKNINATTIETCVYNADFRLDSSRTSTLQIVDYIADYDVLLTENSGIGTSINAHQQVGENFCSEPDVLKVIRLLGYILFSGKILIPFILIVMGTVDYYKAVVSSDEKALGSQTKVLGQRIIIGIIIFFIPNILNGTLNLIGSWQDVKPEFLKCSNCLLEPSSCVVPETPKT